MAENTGSKREGASTDDDQKIRYLRLNQVFNKALSQSIAKFQNYEKVSACFPEYASTHLGKIHLVNCEKQVTEFWAELCHREFQEIMKERNVKEKLDDLDILIAQAKKRLQEQKQEHHIEDTSDKNTLSIAELSVDEIIQCNLHTQRKDTLKELDKRINILEESNQDLENTLKELEGDLGDEYKSLNDLYNQYFGQLQNKSLDKTLTQGLNDMLLESRES
ncbi:similar to Saccharomyces cerevisiae YJR112W NNF1 Essential component of the MIND kinetochore complex (Mtw1p Including Nnf1p-Nsl1p-Dsn1p) [Maudiozyma saulgeensis]|uniref:Kinetochore-associated protein n=1 Tax=Maudiozyma saulgeensis TaxID=1789683 RepID=A0A1X7R6E0_9SACH|nr:similar to Saccharomyces cerevisiae YJR112W NNF1 Essential component of the MIND kinetochore complex (Mtw1p Including Nnf1p-Nsl1p-Dsn1p) [Kazachstania saulgeensis]